MAAISNTSYIPQARLVVIPVYPPIDNGTTPLYNWPSKNVLDNLDFWLDVSDIMIDTDTTLANCYATVTVGDDVLVVGNVGWSNYYIRVSLSAGTGATNYVVAVTAIRADGYQNTWEIGLYCETLAGSPVNPVYVPNLDFSTKLNSSYLGTPR